MTTMKPTRIFSRINLTFLALLTVLAGTLLFAGCQTADSGSSNSSSPSHSGHHH